MMTHQCVKPPHGSGVPYKQKEFLRIVPYIHSHPGADPILDHQDRAPLAGTSPLWSARSAASQATSQEKRSVTLRPTCRQRKASKNEQTRKRKMPAEPPPQASCGSPARTAMLFSTLPVVFGLRLTVQLKSRHASMHHASHPPPKLSRQLPMPPS